MRIGVLVITSLTFALAVRVVLENQELEKLIPDTPLRTLLLFLAPIASLAVIHYTLAVKGFNTRSLQVELLTFAGEACLFVGIAGSAVFGKWIKVPVDECGNLFLPCPDELVWIPDRIASNGIAGLGVVILMGVLWTQVRAMKPVQDSEDAPQT